MINGQIFIPKRSDFVFCFKVFLKRPSKQAWLLAIISIKFNVAHNRRVERQKFFFVSNLKKENFFKFVKKIKISKKNPSKKILPKKILPKILPKHPSKKILPKNPSKNPKILQKNPKILPKILKSSKNLIKISD